MSLLNKNSWARSCGRDQNRAQITICLGQAYLDETGIDKDTGGEGVENAADDASGGGVGIVCRANAQSDGDA